MSITLMAYPMAFLISPEDAKNEKLHKSSDITAVNETIAKQNLCSIRVLTNLEYQELKTILENINGFEIKPDVYLMQNNLQIEWHTKGKYCTAILSGNLSSELLQSYGEEYFQELDRIAGHNVRLLDSTEYFYYSYSTNYTTMKEIYNQLKQQGAKHIYSTAENEVIAELNGQNIKYYKTETNPTYFLETEQKVTILNIGMSGDFEGTNITYGQLTNLKIQTNIKPEELKSLLYSAKYLYYEGNSQTPLKNSDATLNWVLKNGTYVAEFSGINNAAINKEAEIIFRKLNMAAGRDLRLINDQSTIVYTYNTNYTDKGILLNTLLEHGAQELTETGDEISCKLFGMEMIYHKKSSTSAYTLDITQVSNKGECEELINDLNDEYGLNIQEMTYNKIKERLERENMRLESEEVLEDNSIILTIEI